ncbi:hypothetical protein CIH56_25330 [Salmonella enterica]|nr:hypothetical protein [Salmonella enterica]
MTEFPGVVSVENIIALRPAERSVSVMGCQLAVVNNITPWSVRLIRNFRDGVRNIVRRRVEYQLGDVVASQSCEVSLYACPVGRAHAAAARRAACG